MLWKYTDLRKGRKPPRIKTYPVIRETKFTWNSREMKHCRKARLLNIFAKKLFCQLLDTLKTKCTLSTVCPVRQHFWMQQVLQVRETCNASFLRFWPLLCARIQSFDWSARIKPIKAAFTSRSGRHTKKSSDWWVSGFGIEFCTGQTYDFLVALLHHPQIKRYVNFSWSCMCSFMCSFMCTYKSCTTSSNCNCMARQNWRFKMTQNKTIFSRQYWLLDISTGAMHRANTVCDHVCIIFLCVTFLRRSIIKKAHSWYHKMINGLLAA